MEKSKSDFEITWPASTSLADLLRLRAIQTLCRHCPKLLEFLFKPDKPEMHGPAEVMRQRAGVFSSGEQILVCVALDIWFYESHGYAHLMDIARRLDNQNFKAVFEAMVIAREI